MSIQYFLNNYRCLPDDTRYAVVTTGKDRNGFAAGVYRTREDADKIFIQLVERLKQGGTGITRAGITKPEDDTCFIYKLETKKIVAIWGSEQLGEDSLQTRFQTGGSGR